MALEVTEQRHRSALSPFRHSPLHDLESVVWVALWATLTRVPMVTPNETGWFKHWELYQKTFPNNFNTEFRTDLVRQYGLFQSAVTQQALSASSPILEHLDKLLTRLYRLGLTTQFDSVDGEPIPATAYNKEAFHLELRHILNAVKAACPKGPFDSLFTLAKAERDRRRKLEKEIEERAGLSKGSSRKGSGTTGEVDTMGLMMAQTHLDT